MTPQLFSAARVLDTPQAFVIAMAVYAFLGCIVNWPMKTCWRHVAMSLFFLRLCSYPPFCRRFWPAAIHGNCAFHRVICRSIPYWCRYREKDVVAQLIAALNRLNWPRSKLDIKLVCEKDDYETIAAIRCNTMPSNFELVLVPSGGPRTKPKALNYALQFARGEIVAVFDAEDRPHPDQLLEAWQAFRQGGSKLACVQAPLIIGNFRRNLLTRMFAFEYAVLFRGLLPWLARRGLVIPLGGTSNHFRRSCLEQVGGWDAYNVTEDADLGMRLARFGYRIDVISRGTIEDAPEEHGVWHRQRTRWIKGDADMAGAWPPADEHLARAWLVAFRREPDLYARHHRFGAAAPADAAHAGRALPAHGVRAADTQGLWLLALDVINILMAYMSFHMLGAKTMEPTELGGYAYFLAIPIYWVLISLSAWRAVWQLVRQPHLWEKTRTSQTCF
ncbi:xyloglucan glycosyltransferase 1 [Brucella sp. 10RB9215]|nr:xyloglucan glycosyltransferase 1 [Brucella sp. 10RB9215]